MPNRKKLMKFVLAFILILLGTSVSGRAVANEQVKGRVIMVIVNRVTLEDLQQPGLPNIGKLMAAGGTGVMNVNTAGEINDTNAYATIGAGNKAIGSAIGGLTYRVDEIVENAPGGIIYRRNTGFDFGGAKLVNISVASIIRNNEKANYVIVPGALGDAVRSGGGRTGVIGNSDGLKDAPERWAAFIGMDAKGRIDEGEVGTGLLKLNPLAPFGWETDYDKVETLLKKQLADNVNFIVVETGDTARVDAYADQTMVKMHERQKARALRRVDDFIGRLAPLADKQTMIMLVAPLPPAKAVKRDGIKLAPVVIAGGDIQPRSILYTPTTRQPGLLVNYDLAPTVLSFLGLKQPNFLIGLPVAARESVSRQEDINKIYSWLLSSSAVRTPMLRYFARYEGFVLILALLSIFISPLRSSRVMRLLMISLYTLPLTFLLLPLFGSIGLWLSLLLTVIMTVILTKLVSLGGDTLSRLLGIAGLVSVPIVIDVIMGANLMKRAVLSYDLVVGGRFYGIGNEYMGVLIGATILGAVCLLTMKPRWYRPLLAVFALAFAGLTVFFAAPNIGTNAGGALAAAVGYIFTLYLLIWKKLNWRALGILAGAMAAGLGAVIFVNNVLISGSQSHIGRAINMLTSGDYQAIWLTIIRKLLANWYLFLHSPWSFGLIMLTVIMAVMAFRFHHQLRLLVVRYPHLHKGYWGILAGGAAAFAFNDSGIISAALMGLYLVLPVAELVFDEVGEDVR